MKQNKSVEEVVEEFKGLKPPEDNNDTDGWERLDNWVHSTIQQERQTSQEREREIVGEILEAVYSESVIQKIEAIAQKYNITLTNSNN